MKLTQILPLLGIALFIFLLTRLDLKQVISTILTVQPFYLLIALLLLAVLTFLQGFRLYLLLQQQHIYLRLRTVLVIHLKGLFYGTVTPANLGGLSKIYYLHTKSRRSLLHCIPAVVIDKFLDIIIVLGFAALGILFFVENTKQFNIIILALLIIFGLAFYVLLNKRLMKFFLGNFFKLFFKKKLDDEATTDDIVHALPRKRQLIIPFIITLFIWALALFIPVVIAKGLNLHIPWVHLALLYAIVVMLSLIPITVSGLGTREAALITLLAPYNINPTMAVALSLLIFFIDSIVLAFVTGIVTFMSERRKKRTQP